VLSKLAFLSLTTSLLFPMHIHGHEKEQFPYVNDTQFIVVCQKICKNNTPLTLEYILELNFTTWNEGEMHKRPCYEMLFGDVNIANIRFFLATSIYILVAHIILSEPLSLHQCHIHKMT
jgi:hypothetical protein